jgi:Rad3-related DNA helicase
MPFWWQRMRGVTKEELGQLFRAQVDSVLLGLDAFWYGADFPARRSSTS